MSEGNEHLKQTWAEAPPKDRELYAEIQQRVAETQSTGVILRLPYLQNVFDLSLFETDLLLLAIAPEIDLRYQRIYGYLQDNVTRKRPSIELALRLFCCSLAEQVNARSAFLPDSPLLHHHLLLLHEDPTDRPSPLLSRTLKLDDRITEFLLGSDRLDARLCTPRPFAQQVIAKQTLNDLLLPDSVQTALQHLITLDTTHTSSFCLLHGLVGVGKQTCAQAIARAKKRPLLVVALPALLKAEYPFPTLLSLAFREARLYRSLIYLNGWHDLLVDAAHLTTIRQVESEIEQFKGLVFAASQTPWQPASYRYQFIQIELPLPNERSRQQLWQRLLSQKATDSDLNLDYLASAFRLTPGQIQQAIANSSNDLCQLVNLKISPQVLSQLMGDRHNTSQQLGLRASIILLADQGHNHQEIARELQISRDMARLWRNRWLELSQKDVANRRCLSILDNGESILQKGKQLGAYRAGCEGYGELLRQVGQGVHQSCLILPAVRDRTAWRTIWGIYNRRDRYKWVDCRHLMQHRRSTAMD